MFNSWIDIILAGGIIALIFFLIRNDEKWKKKIENQLWLERVRLLLVFVLTNNLKITFDFRDNKIPEKTGYIRRFQLIDDSSIEIALDEVEVESLIISSVPKESDPTIYVNLDTNRICHISIEVDPNSGGGYPLWALEYDEKTGEEFIDERFPIDIGLNFPSDHTIRSYAYFDKILFKISDKFEPFPVPLNTFGGVDEGALVFIKQGGWARVQDN